MRGAPALRRASLRAAAIAALLGACAPADDPERLFADLQSSDTEARQEAGERIDAIVERGDPGVFVLGIRNPSLPVRAQSIVQLSRMTTPEARQVLRGLLAKDQRMMLPFNPIRLKPMTEPQDSRILVAHLIERGGGDPEALDVLLQGSEENQTVDLLRDTCLAVGALGDPKGIPFLEKAAMHPDPAVARGAAQALHQFPGEEALAALGRLLDNPSPEVRGEVVAGLTARRETGVEALLKRVAESDASPELRSTAILALQHTEDPDLVPWLIGLLKEVPEEARPAVVQVLSQRTGQALGPSPEAWRRWYARAHPGASETSR